MTIDRDKIAKKLNEKGATLPCQRCNNNSFTVLEGFSNIHLQENLSADWVIGGPAVPVVHIVCNKCGAITPHALGALDMLSNENVTDGK
jgi:ribosomal protein L37E